MHALRLALAIALTAASGVAGAQGDVLRARGCTSCHDATARKVGPAFSEIRAKYKGNTSSAADIVGRMKEGRGHPKVAGSDAELKAAVEQAISGR